MTLFEYAELRDSLLITDGRTSRPAAAFSRHVGCGLFSAPHSRSDCDP